MIVGIDLGTTTSEIAYIKDGKPVIIRDIPHSARGILPSVVGINQHGKVVIGDLAERLLTGKPEFAVAEVKRLMGRDEAVHLGSDALSPQEVSAMILRYLKQEAEKYLGETIDEAVITVPAYFNAIQRHATRDAGELAGLKVRRLVNEPTAAALAYGIERPGVEERILVYDFGGGTLDVTVLELSEGILDVLASTGNSELGGKDFDERLVAHLQTEMKRSTGIDPARLTPPGARLRLAGGLKAAAKRAKEELSSVDTTTVFIPNIGLSAGGEPIDFEYTLTRATLNRLIRDLVESTRIQIDEALGVKGLAPEEINVVLMVGGSTRVPLVREFVSSYFGGRALRTEISPEEAVVLGAAVLSGIESREIDPAQLVLTDVSAHTLGVATIGERDGDWLPNTFSPLIRKQQTIPRTERHRYSTAHDDQRWFKVEVYQGDAENCDENLFIGEFQCPIPEPGPAGQPIDIEFSYDLSGEVSVTGRDVRSGHSVTKQFRIATNLSGTDKVQAQDRVNRLWGQHGADSMSSGHSTSSSYQPDVLGTDDWKSAPLYPKVSALMTHAQQRLGQMPHDVRPRVSHLVESMKAALLRNDAGELARHEQVLTDVLFELD